MVFHRIFTKVACIAIIFVMGCQSENAYHKTNFSGKVYFASFSGYSLPLKLIDEITEDEAVYRSSYYVATYEKGVLFVVEKYFQGRLFFKHEYSYYGNGTLKEKRGINAEGKETVIRFDEKGTVVKSG